MGGLGPADAAGNYTRPSSDPLTPPALNPEDLLKRSVDQIRVGLPLLQQPRGIDLIAVGAGHHKNATAAHGPQRTKF